MPLSFQEIEKRFYRMPNYRVNVPWDYLEDNIKRYQDPREGGAVLDLDPEFQRFHVWTPEQQAAYVEYILSNGMSGRELYFNCVGWMGSFKGPFVIVDGKQRLHAVRQFLANKLSIFNGHYLKDIKGRLRTTNAYFLFCINDLPTMADVIKWYLQMNTGGTPHTPHTAEEIAKAKSLLEKYKT